MIIFTFLDSCDKTQWIDVIMNCNGCKALIDNMSTKYGTCEVYCTSVGHTCVAAYEDDQNNCVEEAAYACTDVIIGSLLSPTDDVICECVTPFTGNFIWEIKHDSAKVWNDFYTIIFQRELSLK